MTVRRAGGIAYREAGPPSARPVVLLHGFLSSSRQWRGTLERNPDLHLLAPDLPGFGLSRLPRRTQALPDYADALEAWAERLGLGPVALLGHSFGGMVAVDWAGRFPGRVRRLGLVAPAGAPHSFQVDLPLWPLKLPLLRQLFVRLLTARPVARRVFGGMVMGDPESDPRAALDFLWSVRHSREVFRHPGLYPFPELAARLQSLDVPTFLLWGEQDPVLPASDAALFQAHLRDCRATFLPGCGHAPLVERPEDFDGFLRVLAADG